MNGMKINITNLGSQMIRVSLSDPSDVSIPSQDLFVDIKPNSNANLTTSNPTNNLNIIDFHEVVLWRGIVPSNTNLKFFPETKTLKEGDNTIHPMLLPTYIKEGLNEEIHSSSYNIFKNKWLWLIISICIVLILMATYHQKRYY